MTGGPPAFAEIQNTNYFGTSHFPCCITNFPQGWPKFAQSAVLWQPSDQAIIVASLLPLRATIEQANASIVIDSTYPFGDTASITVTAQRPVLVKIRIPGWALNASVNGGGATNGTLVTVSCALGNTSIVVQLNPQIIVERGWGDTLQDPPSDAVAVVRGPLVFALQLVENRTVVRTYPTVPASVGDKAPDYLITTNTTWNLALELASELTFDNKPSSNWSLQFPFDDSGEYPFAITAAARVVSSWGYWRGSNITSPPPVSPVEVSDCGPAAQVRLVPFGSTNIRIGVFPWVVTV